MAHSATDHVASAQLYWKITIRCICAGQNELFIVIIVMMGVVMETLNGAGVRALGFIGLGVMGAPMAGHLLKSGLRVLAYNRTAAKAQAWRAQTQTRQAQVSM